ncbi:hypothetical protein CHS0354_010122, partial [Potamilus streckersoni]
MLITPVFHAQGTIYASAYRIKTARKLSYVKAQFSARYQSQKALPVPIRSLVKNLFASYREPKVPPLNVE